MEATSKARKWGNSLGIVLPNELVTDHNIREGDELEVKVKKKNAGLGDLRGLLKGKLKESVQQLKDESREGWHDKIR